MATVIPATQLSLRIESLLADRQKHVQAIAGIDATLAGVGAALNGSAMNGAAQVLPDRPRRGRPPGSGAAARAAAALAAAPPKKRGRRRSKYATSAEESVMAYVMDKGNPTTQEVKAHYASEGRGGSADNALSKLVKEKKLTREPLKEGRGSRYAVA